MKKKMIVLALIFVLAIPILCFAKNIINPLGRPGLIPQGESYYLIWQDFNGWHIRWYSANRETEFTGEISAKNGEFLDVRAAYPYMKKQEYKIEDKKIVITGSANNPLNGLDFRGQVDSIKFNLLINNEFCAKCIFIGSRARHPKEATFNLLPVAFGLQNSPYEQ